MCIGNMIMEYIAVLENFEIAQFSQLLQKARKDNSVSQAQFREVERAEVISISHGSIHEQKEKETKKEEVWESPTDTLHAKRTRSALRQMDHRWSLQA